MGSTYEIIEPNKVKITFELGAESYEQGVQKAYLKNRGKFNIPGFRKGRAPRKIIELNFGKEVFMEEAINIALPAVYEGVIKELGLKTVCAPDVGIESISEENVICLSAEVFTKPEIEIEKDAYMGIKYEAMDTTVAESAVDEEIDKDREKNARIIPVDRPAQDKDITVIDFEGFIDGVAFEGGKGEDYELVLGSKTFIDTFEEQIIGHNIGDDFEVNVNFPEEYGKEDLNGKAAMFKVQLKEVKYKELPEADDDFAQDVSEFDTFAEYKESIRQRIQEDKNRLAENKKESDIINALCEKVTVEIPEVMVDDQSEIMVRDFANHLRMQGLPLDSYLQYTGQTREDFKKSYREDAYTRVKSRIILESVSAAEGFEVSDEELEQELCNIAESYQMERERLDGLINEDGIEEIKLDMKVKKAVDFIIENAVLQQ